MANKIEVNYEDLEALSKRFSQNYDRWHQFTQLFKTQVNHVYATWEGKGADRFEHEMENLVFPAIQRFGHAMHAGQDTCKKIGQKFQDSEEEAGNLFKADGDGDGSQKFLGGIGTGGAADGGGAKMSSIGANLTNALGQLGLGAAMNAAAGNFGSMDQIGQMGGGKPEDSSELNIQRVEKLEEEIDEKIDSISDELKKAQDVANGIIGNLK
jgi:WXG100 family type VII secretion target